LTTLKQVDEFPASGPRFDLTEHLSQFFTKTILARYGSALADFRTNGPFSTSQYLQFCFTSKMIWAELNFYYILLFCVHLSKFGRRNSTQVFNLCVFNRALPENI
jgi:hypothetical protein